MPNISGDPVGDSVVYNSAISSRLKIVQDGTNKHLEFRSVSITNRELPGHDSWLAFRGVTTDLSRIITFSWTGKLDRGSNALLMDVSDGYSNLITRLQINEQGEIRAAKSVSDNYSTLIGTINYDNYHTFTVNVDPLKNTYNLIVVGVGVKRPSTAEDPRRPIDVTLPILSNLIVVNRERGIIPKPELSFNWDPIQNNGHTYTVASVFIKRN